MQITVSIDDEIAEKVRKIAADKNTTLTAMVRDYLASLATSETPARDVASEEEAAERIRQLIDSLVGHDAGPGTEAGSESAEKFLETVRRLSRPMGPRNWTRDDLYDRPYAYRKRD